MDEIIKTKYNCNFCRSDDYEIRYPTYGIFGGDYKICFCRQCKAYFLGPMPDEQSLMMASNVDYYGKKSEK